MKRKTALYKRGKKILSEAEHKLIVRIPLVRGLRPIVVEPQTIGITVEVENVRVTVTVSIV
ncbi:MAG: hypothetical protein AAB795_03940 [Patescibacteria group bacterium]